MIRVFAMFAAVTLFLFALRVVTKHVFTEGDDVLMSSLINVLAFGFGMLMRGSDRRERS